MAHTESLIDMSAQNRPFQAVSLEHQPLFKANVLGNHRRINTCGTNSILYTRPVKLAHLDGMQLLFKLLITRVNLIFSGLFVVAVIVVTVGQAASEQMLDPIKGRCSLK